MTELSIIGARASVMVYDDTQKKWVPSGSSSGLSKVQIYHHQLNNTFRVVGRKLQDHEVVINCSISKGLKYNQATATFHQWRDSKFVYGLNFSSIQDAEHFARAMMHALEVLCGRATQNTPAIPTNGNGYEEDMGYRTMTREDAAILQQQQQISGNVTPSAQTPTSQANQNNIPQSPPAPQGHHRTSRNSISAPAAPQPPPMSMPQQMYSQTGGSVGVVHNQNGIVQPPSQQLPPVCQQQQQQPPLQPQQSQPSQPSPKPQQPPQQQLQQQQLQLQQQQLQQQQPQATLPNLYHAPQQINHTHPVYSSQPAVNNPYQQQNQSVASSPAAPLCQQNGPIYVSSSQGITSSASANSVGSYVNQQQQQQQQQQQIQQQQQKIQTPPQPPAPPNNIFGQTNGPSSAGTSMVDGTGQYGQIPMAPPMMPPAMAPQTNGISIAPPMNNRGPPAAPPPPPAFGGPNYGGSNGPIPPPAPPMAPPMPPNMFSGPPPPPPMGGGGGGPGAPPPPPPPPMSGANAKKDDPVGDLMGSLAAQLQQARLKKNKTTPQPAENSGSSTSSGGSGNYGTIGRSSKGMASMMDEMAKTLARRRAQVDKKEPEQPPIDDNSKQRPWEKSNTLPHKLGSNSNNGNSNSTNNNNNNNNNTNGGSESPRPLRKRFDSAGEETILKQVNGDGLSLSLAGDLDSLKAEIVREMRQEIQKVKQEILEAIKTEFNRR